MPADWLARDWNYVARIFCCSVALMWAWPRLLPLRGPGTTIHAISVGIIGGLIGWAAWLLLLTPLMGEGAPWTVSEWALRTTAAVLVVPLFEEQLMRGYFLGLGTQWGETKSFDEAFEKKSVRDLAPGEMNAYGVVLSTALFTIGHALVEWPAAVVYGLLMCFIYRQRRDLLTLVIAHATTNFTLAMYVWTTGEWGLWG
ncbi:MAG: CPBP family glutamic-type intramembrane protease [Planctomycetota bacterium]